MLACQTTNYQFFVKYCRYFLNTHTLTYQGIRCQIELIINGDLKMKMGKSWFPESPTWVGIYFGYIDHMVWVNRLSIGIRKNKVLKTEKGRIPMAGLTLYSWDMIWVSHGFCSVDMLVFIAATCYFRSKGIRLQYLQKIRMPDSWFLLDYTQLEYRIFKFAQCQIT